MIRGLFETHIDVADLDRARRFYAETLGLVLGFLDEERRVAFSWVGPRGESMLGLWEKPADQIRPQHFAFRASIEDVLTRAVPYLNERDLPSRNFLNDGTERPMVFGWMPALAISSTIRTATPSNSSRCCRTSHAQRSVSCRGASGSD